MLTIRLSSSYVLIITTPSAGFSERVGARPPATRVNTLFCCECPVALVLAHRGVFYLFECNDLGVFRIIKRYQIGCFNGDLTCI